jgi:hypothetical protein
VSLDGGHHSGNLPGDILHAHLESHGRPGELRQAAVHHCHGVTQVSFNANQFCPLAW